MTSRATSEEQRVAVTRKLYSDREPDALVQAAAKNVLDFFDWARDTRNKILHSERYPTARVSVLLRQDTWPSPCRRFDQPPNLCEPESFDRPKSTSMCDIEIPTSRNSTNLCTYTQDRTIFQR
jgi:hypothetical protein